MITATTKPFDQLTLSDMQSYTQGFNLGVGAYRQKQWLFAGFAQDTYGDAAAPLSTFGQASPGLANIDTPRMVQFAARFLF